MNNLNRFKEFSFAKDYGNEKKKDNNEKNKQLEKVLCNHCGRTSSNGIRCQGICVADNDY
tara:strand:- start:351 stop:530 length:180 start_codon:yes stop_codon:yes gene_type:complete